MACVINIDNSILIFGGMNEYGAVSTEIIEFNVLEYVIQWNECFLSMGDKFSGGLAS
jgi:hypothetical protein